MCGVFGNMCTCLYRVFVLLRLCIFIFICSVFISVWTAATEWQLKCNSTNNINNNIIDNRMTTCISISWNNLTSLIRLFASNTNVTLKMAGLKAETCRWKYQNENIHQWNYMHSVRSSHTLQNLMHEIWNSAFPRPQEPFTCPYSEPDKSNPCPPNSST